MGSVMPPHRRIAGAGSMNEKQGGGNDNNLFSSLICFGDFEELLRLNLESLKWDKIKYDSGSSFSGSLRYTGGACTQDGRIIVSGGCLISTGDATNTCYETHLTKPGKFSRKKSMASRRYAHGCVSLNGYVYALGGFDNKDADGVAPSTLDSCERFSIYENKWNNCCGMNEGRAFAGVCPIGE